MLLTANLGDAKTFSIPLRWGNRQFVPGTEWNLTFTAKSQPDTQLDSAASLQKQLGSDFFILNDKAKIKLLPADTFGSTTITALNPGLLHWDIQAQKTQDALDIRTVASGTLNLFRDVTRGSGDQVLFPPITSGDTWGGFTWEITSVEAGNTDYLGTLTLARFELKDPYGAVALLLTSPTQITLNNTAANLWSVTINPLTITLAANIYTYGLETTDSITGVKTQLVGTLTVNVDPVI